MVIVDLSRSLESIISYSNLLAQHMKTNDRNISDYTVIAHKKMDQAAWSRLRLRCSAFVKYNKLGSFVSSIFSGRRELVDEVAEKFYLSQKERTDLGG